MSGLTLDALRECTGNWTTDVLIVVGGALLDGRTVAVDEQASTYDDTIQIRFKPLDVEACGFRFRAQPRRISVGEVAKYAKPSCKSCKGQGKWSVTRKIEAGKDDRGRKVMRDIEYEQSCSCADRRYKDVHKHFVVDSSLGEWVQLDGLRIDHVDEQDPGTPVHTGPPEDHPSAPDQEVEQTQG